MSKVFIEKTKEGTFNTTVKNIFKNMKGINNNISANKKVFIKPNLFLIDKPESGRITHPELVIAVAKYCYDLGAEVIVGERGGNIDKNFENYQEIYNYAKVIDLDQQEIILKNPSNDNYVINYSLPVPKIIDKADFVISMPGLRTHVLTKISNALKNIMGFLPRSTTRLIHLSGLEEAIVDLNRLFKIDMIISDAIYSLQGEFPANGGKSLTTNFIMTSTDPVALDTVTAKIIGYEPENIDMLYFAKKAGLGEMDLKHIDIIGEIPQYNFILPKPAGYIYELEKSLNIYADNACNKCKRALANGIYVYLKNNKINNPEILKNINFITGKSHQGKLKGKRNLIYGNCAKTYSENGVYEPGCPPLTGSVKRRIEQLLFEKRT